MKHFKLIWLIIAINIICFFIPHEYFKYLTVQSNEKEAFNTVQQSLTYMFLSENWMHLLWNTVFLFALRKIIVMVVPDRLFLVYYLGWGILAGIANYLIAYNFEYSYLIGSSGVLMAFVGYLVVFVGTMELNPFNSFTIDFYTFAAILVSISILQIALGTNVYGNLAHINGFIFGLITGKIYKKLWQYN